MSSLKEKKGNKYKFEVERTQKVEVVVTKQEVEKQKESYTKRKERAESMLAEANSQIAEAEALLELIAQENG